MKSVKKSSMDYDPFSFLEYPVPGIRSIFFFLIEEMLMIDVVKTPNIFLIRFFKMKIFVIFCKKT